MEIKLLLASHSLSHLTVFEISSSGWGVLLVVAAAHNTIAQVGLDLSLGFLEK